MPKEADEGHILDICAIPVQQQQQPSISTVGKPARPVTKRKRATQEDVYDLQCQVLKGQLEEQKLAREKTILYIFISQTDSA